MSDSKATPRPWHTEMGDIVADTEGEDGIYIGEIVQDRNRDFVMKCVNGWDQQQADLDMALDFVERADKEQWNHESFNYFLHNILGKLLAQRAKDHIVDANKKERRNDEITDKVI